MGATSNTDENAPLNFAPAEAELAPDVEAAAPRLTWSQMSSLTPGLTPGLILGAGTDQNLAAEPNGQAVAGPSPHVPMALTMESPVRSIPAGVRIALRMLAQPANQQESPATSAAEPLPPSHARPSPALERSNPPSAARFTAASAHRGPDASQPTSSRSRASAEPFAATDQQQADERSPERAMLADFQLERRIVAILINEARREGLEL
jgi:hypothetical protein